MLYTRVKQTDLKQKTPIFLFININNFHFQNP